MNRQGRPDRVATAQRPIGVFDSGVGGLTVLRALAATLPGEAYLYLGDTARLPYGTKSPATVLRYALQAADALVERGIKCLVVACNTASAAALATMRARYPGVPVIGVIGPGAAAACASSASGRIAVLATEGTVRGGAYQRAIAELRPAAQVTALACPLFVALAEEGWVDGPVVAATVERYLEPLRHEPAARPDTLVLGCTHFPVLRRAIAAGIGPGVTLVDSAATTACVTAAELAALGLCAAGGEARFTFLATDGAERFARVGGTFLGRPIDVDDVVLVDL
ncbi:MAG: glutamate racemase [Gammaproteobacteria bacterium]|nr:glutamate racemase [Gammaproteobacteria bacterium]